MHADPHVCVCVCVIGNRAWLVGRKRSHTFTHIHTFVHLIRSKRADCPLHQDEDGQDQITKASLQSHSSSRKEKTARTPKPTQGWCVWCVCVCVCVSVCGWVCVCVWVGGCACVRVRLRVRLRVRAMGRRIVSFLGASVRKAKQTNKQARLTRCVFLCSPFPFVDRQIPRLQKNSQKPSRAFHPQKLSAAHSLARMRRAGLSAQCKNACWRTHRLSECVCVCVCLFMCVCLCEGDVHPLTP